MWLQVVRHSEFTERAQKQQQRTFEVAPRRGVLYDRNLRALAMTVLVDSIYAVPSELGENKASDAQILAKIVHVDLKDRFTSEPQIESRLNDQRNFAWIARKVDADTASRVRDQTGASIFRRSSNGSIRMEKRPRRRWGYMWVPMTKGSVGWS